MSGPKLNRRALLGGLAATATVSWLGAPRRADASAARVRRGAPLDLRCPGADAFRIEAEGVEPAVVSAVAGRARLFAPAWPADDAWCRLRCTPLADGRVLAPPVEVAVLATPPLFGV